MNPPGTSKSKKGLESKFLILLFFKYLRPLWWKDWKKKFHSFQLLFYNYFTVKQPRIVMKATIKIELRKDYATKEGKQMVCLRHTASIL